MRDVVIITIMLVFGLVVPGIVFGCILTGVASYGRTAIATVSWAICTGSIAVYWHAEHGIDALTITGIMTTLGALTWTYMFKAYLMPTRGSPFMKGGHVVGAEIPEHLVAGHVSQGKSGGHPDAGIEMKTNTGKENE